MKHIMITSVEDLKLKSKNRNINCYIQLNYGLVSSKKIEYCPKRNVFFVLNCIDSTFQTIPEAEITNKNFTNIGEAIQKKALWQRQK